MWGDDHFVKFNFKFSQCHLLDETTTLNTPSTERRKNKKKIQEQELVQPVNILEKNVSFSRRFHSFFY